MPVLINLNSPPTYVNTFNSKKYNDFTSITNLFNKKSQNSNINLDMNFFSGFTENNGQLDNTSVLYYFENSKSSIFFFSSYVLIYQVSNSQTYKIVVFFDNSNPIVPIGLGKLNHDSNFFYQKSFTNVHNFNEIDYYNIYNNIDLRYYYKDNSLKYDFIVHKGGNPQDIKINVSGDVFPSLLNGQMVFLSSKTNEVILEDTRLQVYQDDNVIHSSFLVPSEDSYGFLISKYDQSKDLVIDPVFLGFSTLFGGSSTEDGYDIFVDSSGYIYVTGDTASSNFPLKNPYNSSIVGWDAFVSKLNQTGNGLIFSTFIGGGDQDQAFCITVDPYGSIYIAGTTISTDFPMVNSYNSTNGGGYGDGFIAKFNSAGSALSYSTFIGGYKYDAIEDIVTDSSGNLYVVGYTRSPDFTTKSAYNSTYGGSDDVFIAKYTLSGTLTFSTFFGGSNNEDAYAIAVTSTSIYITGYTSSSNFPTQNAIDSSLGGSGDAFIAKFGVSGSTLDYSTYYGGSNGDYANDITVDSSGNAYITGYTLSTDFPLQNYVDNSLKGTYSAFIAELSSTGSTKLFSTYFGGTGADWGNSIRLDSSNNIYIMGWTSSTDLQVKNAFQSKNNGGTADLFLTKIKASDHTIDYSTYFGGNGYEYQGKIAVTGAGIVYGISITTNADIMTVHAYQSQYGGSSTDCFMFEINSTLDTIAPTVSLVGTANESINKGGTVIQLSTSDDISGVYKVLFNWDNNVTNSTYSTVGDVIIPSGDGSHTLDVYAMDVAGNWAHKLFLFYADDTGPDISLFSPNNSTFGNLNSKIYFNFSTTYASFDQAWYNWDSGSNASLLNPYALNFNNTEGYHILTVFSNDTLNNVNYKIYTFYTDNNPPIINLNTVSNNSVLQSGNNLTFSIFDSYSNINYVYYTWNQSANTNISDPYEVPLPGSDGIYRLNITAVDNAGNSIFVLYYFIIDNTPPSLQSNVANNSISHSGTILYFNIVDTNTIYNASYFFDGNSGSEQLFLTNYSVSLVTGDGVHNITVKVFDTAGNMISKTYFFITDDTLPTVTLQTLNNNSVLNSGTTILFNIFDTNGLQNASYYYDGDFLNNQLFGTNYTTLLIGGDGQHNLTVIAFDHAGNYVLKTYSFVTDDTNPTVLLLEVSNNTILHSGTSLSFDITDANNIQNVTYYFDGNSANPLSFSINFTVSLISGDGQHSITVKAFDMVGNYIIETFIFITDDTAPTVTLNNYMNNSIIQNGNSFNFGIGDNFGVKNASYYFDGAYPSPQYFQTNYTIFLNLSDGNHLITIISFDFAGNMQNITFGFVIDGTIPSIQLINIGNNTILQSNTLLVFNLSDVDGIKNASYYYDGNSITPLTFSSNYTINLIGGDGTHNLTIITFDAVGNNATKTFVFIVDDTIPDIQLLYLTNNSYVGINDILEFDITDTNGVENASYYYDGYPASSQLFSNGYNLTVNTSEGYHTLTLVVFDVAGNSIIKSFVFITDNSVPIVELNSPTNNTQISSTTQITFNITDSLSGVNEISYYWDQATLNTSLTVNGNQYSLPNNDINGLHILHIYVKDLVGNWKIYDYVFTTVLSYNVNNRQDPMNVVNGQKYNFSVIFTNNENFVVNYTVYVYGQDDTVLAGNNSKFTLDPYGSKELDFQAISKHASSHILRIEIWSGGALVYGYDMNFQVSEITTSTNTSTTSGTSTSSSATTPTSNTLSNTNSNTNSNSSNSEPITANQPLSPELLGLIGVIVLLGLVVIMFSLRKRKQDGLRSESSRKTYQVVEDSYLEQKRNKMFSNILETFSGSMDIEELQSIMGFENVIELKIWLLQHDFKDYKIENNQFIIDSKEVITEMMDQLMKKYSSDSKEDKF